MICAYSHSGSILLADLYKRCKFLANSIEFCLIRRLCIVNFFKPFFVSVVSRIDSHFLDQPCSQLGCIGSKMNISDERHRIATAPKFFLYHLQVLSFFETGRCDSNIFTPCIDHPYHLLNRSLGVHGVHCGH